MLPWVLNCIFNLLKLWDHKRCCLINIKLLIIWCWWYYGNTNLFLRFPKMWYAYDRRRRNISNLFIYLLTEFLIFCKCKCNLNTNQWLEKVTNPMEQIPTKQNEFENVPIFRMNRHPITDFIFVNKTEYIK